MGIIRTTHILSFKTAVCLIINKKPTTTSFILVGYRLCVCASGSLATDIFIFCTLIIVSCLHFGQKSGKFFSSVSSRILILDLFRQTGHNTHSLIIICFSPVSINNFCSIHSLWHEDTKQIVSFVLATKT